MFTGLIEEIGKVGAIENYGNGYRIHVDASKILDGTQIGDSIAINGVCLTVVSLTDQSFTVEAVSETVDRTALSGIKNQDPVNLERALRASDRLGGHFVQGHVDGIAKVVKFEKRDPGYWLSLQFTPELEQYMVEKGSVSVNGISLTIAALSHDQLSIAVIPHTAETTTLYLLKPGNVVNIEVDILAKYMLKMLNNKSKKSGITPEMLDQFGY